MTLTMLSIIVPVAIDDVIIDWLLEQDDIHGFNSLSIFGHGSDEDVMSIGEKVSGKSRRTMFQTHVEEDLAKAILSRLKKAYPSSDIHYMIRPMIDAGNLKSYE